MPLCGSLKPLPFHALFATQSKGDPSLLKDPHHLSHLLWYHSHGHSLFQNSSHAVSLAFPLYCHHYPFHHFPRQFSLTLSLLWEHQLDCHQKARPLVSLQRVRRRYRRLFDRFSKKNNKNKNKQTHNRSRKIVSVGP